MADVTITIDDKEVREMLRRTPRDVDRALRLAMRDAVTLLTRDMKEYPRAPFGSTYIRTNVLKDSWSNNVQVRGGEVTGIVGSNSNMAPYNRYVQDEPKQAEIHQGRWNTVQSVAEMRQPTIERMFSVRLRYETR